MNGYFIDLVTDKMSYEDLAVWLTVRQVLR